MNNEQVSQLLALLEKIAGRQYTIAGAADWPILVVIGGILIAVIGFMWNDLRTIIKDNKSELRLELMTHKTDNEKSYDILWAELHRCQDECCPPRRKPE